MSKPIFVLEKESDGYISHYNLGTKEVYYTDYLLNAVSFEDREVADFIASHLGCNVKRV